MCPGPATVRVPPRRGGSGQCHVSCQRSVGVIPGAVQSQNAADFESHRHTLGRPVEIVYHRLPSMETATKGVLRMLGTLRHALVALFACGLVSCEKGVGGDCAYMSDCKGPLQCINGKCTRAEKTKPTTAQLPEHRFRSAGRNRSQIRAIAKRATLTQKQFEELAVALANKHKAGHTLVQFFSDKSVLKGWDGSGALRDQDWPHWLCRIRVDTGPNGNRSAGSFVVAKDPKTGEDRTDVLAAAQ